MYTLPLKAGSRDEATLALATIRYNKNSSSTFPSMVILRAVGEMVVFDKEDLLIMTQAAFN